MHDKKTAPNGVLIVSHACILSSNREVYRCLHRMGYKISLLIAEGITQENGEFYSAEPVSLGDPLVEFRPTVGRNLRLLRYVGFFNLLDTLQPKIILVESDPASVIALQAAIWCRLHDARLICRTNENLSWSLNDAVKRLGITGLPKSLVKTAMHNLIRNYVSAVCTSSEEAKILFHQRGYRRVENVPMGTDSKKFHYDAKIRRASRSRFDIPASAHVVAYFGRMVPEKGVDTLVDALVHLKDLPWFLLLNKFQIADDYAKRVEAKIVTLGLSERVIWVTGTHGQIAETMMAADVVVLPSRTTPKWVEQFGRVVPEGMACGAVLLVSDSGAPKELVPYPECVFPENNADYLVILLRRLKSDPSYCRMLRRRGMRHVRRHLSINVEAGMYARLFEDL